MGTTAEKLTKAQLRERLEAKGVKTTTKMTLSKLEELYEANSEGEVTARSYAGKPESWKLIMDLSYPMIRDAVRTNPMVLTALKDPKKIKYANSFLPKDTGIEFEVAFKIDNTAEKDYESMDTRIYKKSNQIDYSLIRNLEVGFNRDFHGYPEKRFRIKSGVKGMIQLFNLSLFMNRYALLNEKSIIHMHVGSSSYPYMSRQVRIIAKKYIHLFDPSVHHFIDNYNLGKSTWLNYNDGFSTMEYRGVPLSFSYSHLIKYAILCQKITAYIDKHF